MTSFSRPRSYWYVCLYDKDTFELLEIVPAGGFLNATLLRVDFIRAGFDPFFVRLTSLHYALSESDNNIPAWLYRLRPKTYTSALRSL